MNSNLHLRKVATIVACLAATTMFVNAQTGTYTGDATVKETQYFNINETVNGVSVNLTSSTGGYYELSVSNLQFSGIDVPTIVMDNVTVTGSGGAYTLSRTGSVQNTIPTLTVPAGIPIVGGMTFNNVPVAVTLTDGQIANSVMTLNMQVKITLPTTPFPITVTFLTGFTGTLNAATHPALGGGSGTSGDPYLIKTPAHLKALADYVNAGNGESAEGVYYKLMNDIDLSSYASGAGWESIGYNDSYGVRFCGNFNGNGKVVKNLTINSQTIWYAGLFGRTYQANIKNLGVECNIIGGQQATGGLIAKSEVTTISGCYVSGNIKGNHYVGGLVGIVTSGAILNCYSTVNISGTNNFKGGLAGYIGNSNISYCYAAGDIIGDGWYAGGLVGQFSAEMKNCVAANGSVSASSNNGANRVTSAGSGTLQNNYANSAMSVTVNGNPVSITDGSAEAGTGKSMAELQSLAFYTTTSNWNGGAWDIADPNGVWKICDGKGLPSLRWQGIDCNNNEVVTVSATAEISIYPNPTNYELRITNYEGTIKNVEILDLSGKIILNSQLSTLNSINVANLASGVYFVKIETDKGTLTRKFIKN